MYKLTVGVGCGEYQGFSDPDGVGKARGHGFGFGAPAGTGWGDGFGNGYGSGYGDGSSFRAAYYECLVIKDCA
jgi:hypothetical protein